VTITPLRNTLNSIAKQSAGFYYILDALPEELFDLAQCSQHRQGPVRRGAHRTTFKHYKVFDVNMPVQTCDCKAMSGTTWVPLDKAFPRPKYSQRQQVTCPSRSRNDITAVCIARSRLYRSQQDTAGPS
jgi:hypothetical protein